jgi:hypothetical protein
LPCIDPGRTSTLSLQDDLIEISSVTSPGRTEHVKQAKYITMRDALLPVPPDTPPGKTVAENEAALLLPLSEGHLPGGAKSGRWLRAVQLDLDARGFIARGETGPTRTDATACRGHRPEELSDDLPDHSSTNPWQGTGCRNVTPQGSIRPEIVAAMTTRADGPSPTAAPRMALPMDVMRHERP